jgi:tryptophanase
LRIEKRADAEGIAVRDRRDGAVVIGAENAGALDGDAVDDFGVGLAEGIRFTHRNCREARMYGVEKRLRARGFTAVVRNLEKVGGKRPFVLRVVRLLSEKAALDRAFDIAGQ